MVADDRLPVRVTVAPQPDEGDNDRLPLLLDIPADDLAAMDVAADAPSLKPCPAIYQWGCDGYDGSGPPDA